MKFGDVAVVVADVKRAKKWYTETLGFKVKEDEGHWITVVSGEDEVQLHLCETKPLERGNTGIGFTVKDVAAEEARLRSRGVRFTKPTTKGPAGMTAWFEDPDGNEFWLSQE